MLTNKLAIVFFLFVLVVSCSSDDSGPVQKEEEITEDGEFLDDWTYRVFPKAPNNNYDIGEFRLWVPENPTDLKAILVLLTNYNGNSLGLPVSADWQAYAEKERLALVGVHLQSFEGTYFYDDATRGSGQALEDAIKTIASKNGIEKVADLPFLLRGYSGGGVFSYYFSIHSPERTVGFVNIRGGSLYHNPANNTQVPGLLLVGSLEGNQRIDLLKGIVLDKRLSGGPWSFAVERDADHFYFLEASDELAKVYFSSLLKKRISVNTGELKSLAEDSGWLGNIAGTKAFPFADYPDEKDRAIWLVDEDFAKAWIEYQK